jgi:hypothetical protein
MEAALITRNLNSIWLLRSLGSRAVSLRKPEKPNRRSRSHGGPDTSSNALELLRRLVIWLLFRASCARLEQKFTA